MCVWRMAYIPNLFRKYNYSQYLQGGIRMKVVAGIVVVMSILGLIVSLSANEKYTGYGVMLKLMLFCLSVCSGVFGILFLIIH